MIAVEFATGVRRRPVTAPCAFCAADTTHELVWIARNAQPDMVALHVLERPERQQSLHCCERCLHRLRQAHAVTTPGPEVIAWGRPVIEYKAPCQCCTEPTQSVLVFPACTTGNEVSDYKITAWCGRCLWQLQHMHESAYHLLPQIFAPPL